MEINIEDFIEVIEKYSRDNALLYVEKKALERENEKLKLQLKEVEDADRN